MSQMPFDDPYANPYADPFAQWDDASNVLNKYISGSDPNRTINWDKAKDIYGQHAQSGKGNQGDWVNWTFDARDKWLNPVAQAPQQAAPAQAGRFDLEAMRKALGFGKVDMSNPQAWLDANRNIAGGATIRGDKLYDPSGRYVADVISNYKSGGRKSQFLDGIDSGTGKPRTLAGPAKPPSDVILNPVPPTTTTPPPSAPPPPAPPTEPETDPLWDALYQQLLDRSNQTLTVGRDNPIIRAQADAYAAQQERARRNDLADLAERSGPNANLRGEQRLASERMGQSIGAFEAELMQRELNARREEIQNALTQRQGMLTTAETLALQEKLALIDDATRRLDINNRNSQFYAGLSQQKKEFAESMKFKYKELSQQDKQFMKDLGYRWSGRQWEMDPANPANRL